MYLSKEAIETAAIADAQQFYTFHGGQFKLGNVVEATVQIPSIITEKQLDSRVSIVLDEINANENNYIMRASETVDSKQLTEATYLYLNQMAKTMGIQPPARSDIQPLTNEVLTASRIHDSGWLIYSIQTKTVTTEGLMNVEERIIEIK